MVNLYPGLRPVFTCLFKLLFRPKIINKENIPKEGAIVIACNHRHALDPIFIGSCTKRTIHYLAKKELYKGVFSLFFKSVGTLPVNRNSSDNKSTIESAEKELLNGGTIGIFPEGTRNRTDKDFLPFKKGAVRFALNTNSLMVPVYTKGKYRFFNKDLTIIIGKPYKLTGSIEEENEKLLKKMKQLKKECK